MSQDQGWHLDKRVPISIIGVLVAEGLAQMIDVTPEDRA